MRLVIRLLFLLAVFRIAWISSALYAPFLPDSEAPKRTCPNGKAIVGLDLKQGTVVSPDDSIKVGQSSQFAYPPEEVTSGLRLTEYSSAGCRWLLGVIPPNTSRAEMRRLGVAVRHKDLPIVVVSNLASPLISLGDGVVARAGFLNYLDRANIFGSEKLLVSYGIKKSAPRSTESQAPETFSWIELP